MNINSVINWQKGMELTPQTFINQDERIDFKQRAALGIALGGTRFGLVPGMPLAASGVFVKNNYEIDPLQFTALLPSGELVQVDETLHMTVPLLGDGTYYLAAAPTGEWIDYELKGVAMRRPAYGYELVELETLTEGTRFPLVRLSFEGGRVATDDGYIPPALTMASDPRFEALRADFAASLEQIASHPHLPEGSDGRRQALRLLFKLRRLPPQSSVTEFVELTQEIAFTLDYYILKPAAKQTEIPTPNLLDISLWLQWLTAYLSIASKALEELTPEDNKPDFEEMKRQIKAEIYEELNPELYRKLIDDLRTELGEKLPQQLFATVVEYMEGTVRPSLQQAISAQLEPALYDGLYQRLYDTLYNALFVPKEEEDAFTPMI